MEHQIVHTETLDVDQPAEKNQSQKNRLSHSEMQMAVRKAQLKLKVAQESVEQAEKYKGAREIWATTDGGLWNPNLAVNKTPVSSYGQ